jgi:ribonuclease BN (tRNA processing enzyme)
LRRQQDAPSFPVDFSFLHADIEFVHLEPDRPHAAAGMTVTTMLQRHAGDSYGYRFEANGKSVVYTTDSEHKLDDPLENGKLRGVLPQRRRRDLRCDVFARRCRFRSGADWGHSSNVVGVELCQMAGARHLCLFHHEPANSDQAIDAVLADTRRLEEITRTGEPLAITAAYDGMEIEL